MSPNGIQEETARMYSSFAQFYDLLTADVNYDQRARYFSRLIQRHYWKKQGLLLDLCCGTGSLSWRFARQGWDVIGVDASPEMLSQACAKASEFDVDAAPMFLCQKMECLDLFGTVDVCICALDSMNHITDPFVLQRVFERLSLFVESGGLFVFDVNTFYKHEKILSGNTFVLEEENTFCVWQNSECKKGVVEMDLDFFERLPNGTYRRKHDTVTERAYPAERLIAAGKRAGFELLSTYKADSFAEPSSTDERLVYVMENMTEHLPPQL